MRRRRRIVHAPEPFGYCPAVVSIVTGLTPYALRNLLHPGPRGTSPQVRSVHAGGRRLVVLGDVLEYVNSCMGGRRR